MLLQVYKQIFLPSLKVFHTSNLFSVLAHQLFVEDNCFDLSSELLFLLSGEELMHIILILLTCLTHSKVHLFCPQDHEYMRTQASNLGQEKLYYNHCMQ